MKILFLVFFINVSLFSQNRTDTLRVMDIPEVTITRNQTSSFEKKLKVKWLLKEDEELVTYISNIKNIDYPINNINFRIVNLSGSINNIIFKIYSSINDLPGKEIFVQNIIVKPGEEINKLSFTGDNALMRKEGVFIGFKYAKRDGDKGIYVFTETSQSKKNTYIKKNNLWKLFYDENVFLPVKFRNIGIYYKIK